MTQITTKIVDMDESPKVCGLMGRGASLSLVTNDLMNVQLF